MFLHRRRTSLPDRLLRRSKDWKIRQTFVRQTLDAAFPVPSDKIMIFGTAMIAPREMSSRICY